MLEQVLIQAFEDTLGECWEDDADMLRLLMIVHQRVGNYYAEMSDEKDQSAWPEKPSWCDDERWEVTE